MSNNFREKFNDNSSIDYQVKMDELLKETVFLQKYTPVNKWQEKENEERTIA